MPRRVQRAAAGAAALLATALLAAPASAAWRLASARQMPGLYNQGIAVDPAAGSLFFAGVSSARNSALVRTRPTLAPLAARTAAIPPSRQGYNHVGDLSFDPVRRRLLLPLECYYPDRGGNTCRRGALGVASPATLRMVYRVELNPGQIAKAMWAESSPDGRWVWTSSGRRLLAYPAAAINPGLAARQRSGAAPGLTARDLGPVLPTPAVTGAAARPLPGGGHRLFLSLNRGSHFQVVSYAISVAPDGAPVVSGPARVELSLTRTAAHGEPEGLALTRRGTLLWGIIAPARLTARLLGYAPA
jgi:hypothetical protein